MIESPLIDEWRAQGSRRVLGIFLEARFGSVPNDIVVQLQTVTDEKQFDELAGAAVLCTDLEGFRAKLKALDAVLIESRGFE